MRILIHANAPTAPTGYGVQTALLATRLAADGHEVAVSCTWGHQGSVGKWTTPRGDEVRLYPAGYETNGNDVIHNHADHWFDGDASAGWIITLLDVWSLPNPLLSEFQVVAWTPVDHLPAPPGVVKFFDNRAVPLAMSEFGRAMLQGAGLNATTIPLTVDTTVFRPTFQLDTDQGVVASRELFDLPLEAFVVGMVAMNKGWARDRKGFNEAFRAFAQFHVEHPESILYLHTEKHGAAEGLNLPELASHAGIPESAIRWSNQYAYRIGFPDNMMAALYTSFDVLLAPSHGEGFGVPLIEAQACGTPVITSRFSSTLELVGPGWLVDGQPEWDPAQHANYICPFIHSIVEKLEAAYGVEDWAMLGERCREFAETYDADVVYEQQWRPFLATLEPTPVEPKPKLQDLDVLVPLVRAENAERLFASFNDTVGDNRDVKIFHGVSNKTFAENLNWLLRAKSGSDWVLVVGDDVEFTPGWFDALVEQSEFADVIGTNDSEKGRVRNPDVAAGRHADHFAVRRSYIDEVGACLDGPGSFMPEAYRHWYTDREVIELAKARGVFRMAPECRIIHHHPGYDGDEEARESDELYMAAVASSADDQATWMERAPLIEMHRVTRR